MSRCYVIGIKSRLGGLQSIFLSMSSKSSLASNKLWDHKFANPNRASVSIHIENSGIFPQHIYFHSCVSIFLIRLFT